MVYFELVIVCCLREVCLHSVACGCPLVPIKPFVEEIFFLFPLDSQNPCKNQWDTVMWVYFWALNSFPWILYLPYYLVFLSARKFRAQCETYWQVSRNLRDGIVGPTSPLASLFPCSQVSLLLLCCYVFVVKIL